MRALLLLIALTASAFAADISGKWDFSVSTPAGNGNPTFVFKQDGEKLSGTYHGFFGSAQLKGTVKGDDVEYAFSTSNGTVTYKGKVSGNSMKGTVKLEDLGDGTFSGAKK